jgi:hypothetical protein
VGASRSRRRRTAGWAALLLAALLPASAAARTVTVRWRYDAPGVRVAGFKLYTRHVDQKYGAGLDVGLPPARDGVYSWELEVSDRDASWVGVSAYDGSGAESAISNERLFLLPEPGDPPDR